MPARTKPTQQKRTLEQISPEIIKSKKVSTAKYTYTFLHECTTITPSSIDIVLDLEERSYTFSQSVSVIWKSVQHSGVQPPKTFARKNGEGSFDKPVGLEIYIDPTDKTNLFTLKTLEELSASIAHNMEEKVKELLKEGERFVGREMARDDKEDTCKIIDLPITRSELQISGRLSANKAGFKGPTDIGTLRAEYAQQYPEADQNIMVIPGDNGEYLTVLKNAREYYEGIYGMIGNRLPEPEEFKFVQFETQVISVACNLTGSKAWTDKATGFGQIKPNLYLDKIRVFLDGEKDNGDNARWCMKFWIPKISVEHFNFLDDNM